MTDNLLIRLKRLAAKCAFVLLALLMLALTSPLWSCNKLCKAEYKVTGTQEDEDDTITSRQQVADHLIEEMSYHS
jgi:hypothetical protein